jgi:hypothetical protein
VLIAYETIARLALAQDDERRAIVALENLQVLGRDRRMPRLTLVSLALRIELHAKRGRTRDGRRRCLPSSRRRHRYSSIPNTSRSSPNIECAGRYIARGMLRLTSFDPGERPDAELAVARRQCEGGASPSRCTDHPGVASRGGAPANDRRTRTRFSRKRWVSRRCAGACASRRRRTRKPLRCATRRQRRTGEGHRSDECRARAGAHGDAKGCRDQRRTTDAEGSGSVEPARFRSDRTSTSRRR